MRTYKRNLLLTTIFFITTSAYSQIDFVTSKTPLSEDVSIVEIEPPQITDNELSEKNGEAFEIAKLIPTNIDFIEQAEKTELVNGYVWRLGIHSEGAKAISLYYDQFDIPYGGELFLYTVNQTQIAGPFTYEHVHPSGVYATEFIKGDKVILEYFQPNYQTLDASINIENIAYAYKSVGGGSDYCQVNANCPEGDDWDDQKKATCRIQIVNGFSVGLCSANKVSCNCFSYK